MFHELALDRDVGRARSVLHAPLKCAPSDVTLAYAQHDFTKCQSKGWAGSCTQPPHADNSQSRLIEGNWFLIRSRDGIVPFCLGAYFCYVILSRIEVGQGEPTRSP